MPVCENAINIFTGIQPEIGNERIRLPEHGQKETLEDVTFVDNVISRKHRLFQFILEPFLRNTIVHVDKTVGAVAAHEGVYRVRIKPRARIEHRARAEEILPRNP